jgi:hypothetical protein
MRERVRSIALVGILSVAACSGRGQSLEQTDTAPSAIPTPTTRPKPEPSHSIAAAPRFESEEELDNICRQFSDVSLPPADQPLPAERRALAKCDAEKLYYGIGVRPDYVAARKCAYAELERKEASLFGGATLLMTLYANGRGVPTNFDLALRFACTRKPAAGERRAAIEALWKARAGSGLSEVFDVCAYETATAGRGDCVARDSRIAGAKREARKAKAVMGLRSRELAFLEKAAHEFFDARVHDEIDSNSPLRASFQVEERDRLAEEYVDLLEKLSDRQFSPRASEGSDAHLSAFHARLLGCKELNARSARKAGFSRPGLVMTQRRWISYRDAWLGLVAKARSRTALPAWKALLVEQRIRMLETVPLCQSR